MKAFVIISDKQGNYSIIPCKAKLQGDDTVICGTTYDALYAAFQKDEVIPIQYPLSALPEILETRLGEALESKKKGLGVRL